jgi:hypothetical protein
MLDYALSFVAGFLVKSVDWIEDDLKKALPIRWILAIIAGFLIGLLIAWTSFSVVFMAALFSQVFAKKVDKMSHAVTVLAAAVTFAALGIGDFQIYPFLILLVPAFVDEFDFPKPYNWLTDYRVFLNLSCLLFAVFAGRWDYFFGILSFDLGYLMFKHLPPIERIDKKIETRSHRPRRK